MKRLLVFGLGIGGESVAEYLESELSTVEVIRLIDWRSELYDSLLPNERNQKIVEQLRPYIGKVEVIVLGSYLLSSSLPYLKRCFPEQNFVGMGINTYRISQNIPGTTPVVLLMSPALHNSLWFDELCLDLDFIQLTTPNCAGWEQLIDRRAVSSDILRADLQGVNIALRKRASYKRRGRPHRSTLPLAEQISIERTNHNDEQTAAQSILRLQDNIEKYLHPKSQARKSQKLPSCTPNSAARSELVSYKKPPTCAQSHSSLHSPAQQSSRRRITDSLPRQPSTESTILPNTPGLVLLLSTHFWSIKPELEQIFGWRVKIMDFRKKLLHDVCAALGLRGVHGDKAR